MKTLAFLIIFLASLTIQTQNRISTWDKSKITNIKIEVQKNGKIEKSVFFNDQKQLDQIFKFLESIDFKDSKPDYFVIPNIEPQEDNWTSRFIFRGQRDWIILWENTASIGKTSFWINNDVNQKVKKLIEELEK
jgi:hypothetical protein